MLLLSPWLTGKCKVIDSIAMWQVAGEAGLRLAHDHAVTAILIHDGWEEGVLLDDLLETDHTLVVEDIRYLTCTGDTCLSLLSILLLGGGLLLLLGCRLVVGLAGGHGAGATAGAVILLRARGVRVALERLLKGIPGPIDDLIAKL